MTFKIRALELTDTDLEAYVRLSNRVYTDEVTTVTEERHWLKSAPAEANWQLWVAMLDGEMVGKASNSKQMFTDRPGSYRIHVAVDPSARKQGIGTKLYDHCMSQLHLHHDDVQYLFSATREHYEDGVRFLAKRGFQLKMREPLSQLQMDRFDPTPFLSKAEQAETNGYQIFTLAELQKECRDWAEKYFQLDNEAMKDVPSTDPFVPPPFELFEKRHLGDPFFNAHIIWIAVRDEEWLGLTSLWITDGDPEKGHTGLTGVLRKARRQGVATALKLKALDYARNNSIKIVQTDNEENNPMFQINLALGFKAIPASLFYRKDCGRNN